MLSVKEYYTVGVMLPQFFTENKKKNFYSHCT